MSYRDLREWADEHGHTADYDKCRNCGEARQDCTCCDDIGTEDEDDDPEEDEV